MVKMTCLYLLMIMVGSTWAASDLNPTHLHCEFTENPMGVDMAKPRMYWWVESETSGQKQTAYQILVASCLDTLDQESGDLWDSGKIESNQTTHVRYQGKSLASSQQVFWKLRVWDKDGLPSDWSTPATWTMGLLEASDWQARWIVAPWVSEALLLRKEFSAESKVKRALVHVCGLGQYNCLSMERRSDKTC